MVAWKFSLFAAGESTFWEIGSWVSVIFVVLLVAQCSIISLLQYLSPPALFHSFHWYHTFLRARITTTTPLHPHYLYITVLAFLIDTPYHPSRTFYSCFIYLARLDA